MTNHLYRPIQDLSGNIVTDATVSIFQPGTTTPIASTIYSDAALSSPLTNPYPATTGVIDLYVATPQTVDIGIQRTGGGLQIIKNIDIATDVLASAPQMYSFYVPGTLATGVVPQKHYVEANGTIQSVRIAVGTQPVGANVQVDTLVNGTSVYTSSAHAPSIAPGTDNAIQTTIDTPAVTGPAQLQVQILSVGSGTAGSDLLVQVVVVPTAVI
jgi:hypothetical protein